MGLVLFTHSRYREGPGGTAATVAAGTSFELPLCRCQTLDPDPCTAPPFARYRYGDWPRDHCIGADSVPSPQVYIHQCQSPVHAVISS